MGGRGKARHIDNRSKAILRLVRRLNDGLQSAADSAGRMKHLVARRASYWRPISLHSEYPIGQSQFLV
jgi:hypothetical protein